MNRKRTKVWDLPVRIFHWTLAFSMVAVVISGQLGGNLIDWHARIGLLVVGLVVFRLVWGVLGSSYARFAHFFPTPSAIRAYLAGTWQGEGHNPLGALSVFALLGLLVCQLLTGLVANDDIAFRGPLFELVGEVWSNRLTGLHHKLGDLLIGLGVLHVAAVVYYVRVKGKNLLKPMLTGWKEDGHAPSATGGGIFAFVIALVIACGAVYAASGVWLPKAEAGVVVETPNF